MHIVVASGVPLDAGGGGAASDAGGSWRLTHGGRHPTRHARSPRCRCSPALPTSGPRRASDPPAQKPLPVRLAGERLVLFRDESGRARALIDRCPHRGWRCR